MLLQDIGLWFVLVCFKSGRYYPHTPEWRQWHYNRSNVSAAATETIGWTLYHNCNANFWSQYWYEQNKIKYQQAMWIFDGVCCIPWFAWFKAIYIDTDASNFYIHAIGCNCFHRHWASLFWRKWRRLYISPDVAWKIWPPIFKRHFQTESLEMVFLSKFYRVFSWGSIWR